MLKAHIAIPHTRHLFSSLVKLLQLWIEVFITLPPDYAHPKLGLENHAAPAVPPTTPLTIPVSKGVEETT